MNFSSYVLHHFFSGVASVDTDPQTFDFATSVCNPALGFAVSSGIRGSLSDIELGEFYW